MGSASTTALNGFEERLGASFVHSGQKRDIRGGVVLKDHKDATVSTVEESDKTNCGYSQRTRLVRQNKMNFEEDPDTPTNENICQSVKEQRGSSMGKKQPIVTQPLEKRKQLLRLSAFIFEDEEHTGTPIKSLADLYKYKTQEICCTMTVASGAIKTVVPFLTESVAQSTLLTRRQKRFDSTPL